MARYVALLRGINVGGITIAMADLKEVFAGLDFGNVRTVLASGNVVFDADTADTADAKARIEAALRHRFGYEAFVFVHAQPAVAAIVDAYPFEERDGRHAYAMFVADPAVLDELAATANGLDPAVERVARGNGVLYWDVERGQTVKSAFGRNTGKPRYKAVTTTRNLRTLRKLQV
ncbi:DUF1697 domain-containing protein [Rhodococcus sp. 14C212]|uniref:DUF1697 domain-containing protein n=1 Tax=Rhodococcus sp. 14C212 TaxID=2711209 RepID=UPI0013E9F9CF|nr:DUF1697 domain-containing protein [Rhodococcus sp. 14C212]NGP06797.1 DUF1697 domain-containing protein [Rhodococcus sp. 14C212]